MFCLIRNEIKKEPLPNDAGFDIQRIYEMSKKHDMAHLIANAVITNGMVSPESELEEKLSNEFTRAVCREILTSSFLNKVCQIFTENEIKYIPLKGAVIRNYYPEIWMRTSCDIDILIHEEDIDKATKALLDNGFTTDSIKNYHDIRFYFGKILIELHFSICENNKQLDRLLSKVWDHANPISAYEYQETPEYFVFHHIAHMAHHFLTGGCGIRPFIDLYVLKEKHFYDEEKLLPFLKESDLIKFYHAAVALAYTWMGEGQYDELSSSIEKYIINGGVYGSEDNENMVGTVAYKGKRMYLLKLAFPPYRIMRVLYPTLNKRKILLPFYYVYRVITKIFGKDRKKVKRRIDNTFSQQEENLSFISNLLNELQLSK